MPRLRLSRRVVAAATAYAVIVFSIGFALGAVRTLVVAPRVGRLAAVALELPLILCAAWLVCGRVLDRFGVARGVGERATLGAFAFGLVMLIEYGLATTVFGTPPAAYLRDFGTAAGLLGLAGQLGFAAFPLLRRDRSGEAATDYASTG